MRRRTFLAAASGGALAAPAIASGRKRLLMATSWGRGLAGVFESAEYCARLIESASDGRLSVDVKAAGERFGAFEVFDAVREGRADLYHSADYYFLERHPGYAFFTTVPFGMTAMELGDWYYHGGGHQLHRELGEAFGLVGFLAGNTGAQGGGWFRRPIGAVADFQGIRFRMPGLGGEVLKALGATVLSLPGAEVYQHLSTGALDGAEWIGPWTDEKAGFQEIAKHYYAAGFHEPGTGFTLGVNRDVFLELSAADQKLIEVAAAASHQWTLHLFNNRNAGALGRLAANGVEIHQFPDEVWDAFGAATGGVMARYDSDPLYARIRDSYVSSMRKSSAWESRSTRAYVRQRDRILG